MLTGPGSESLTRDASGEGAAGCRADSGVASGTVSTRRVSRRPRTAVEVVALNYALERTTTTACRDSAGSGAGIPTPYFAFVLLLSMTVVHFPSAPCMSILNVYEDGGSS